MPTRLLATSALALILATPGFAQEMNFNRVAAFPVARNLPEAEETSAEIIAATEDGMTLVYTDSPAGSVGFIDITDPAAPAPSARWRSRVSPPRWPSPGPPPSSRSIPRLTTSTPAVRC